MKIIKLVKGSNKANIISVINNHDLMIIGGGGIYSKWTLPFDIEIIDQIKIPIVLFSIGYNHNYTDANLSDKDKFSIYKLNKKATIISVRDERTLEIVKSSSSNGEIIGDPAIFLKSRKVKLLFNKNFVKIGINISNHEAHTEKEADKILKIYTRLIYELRKKYNIQVFYLKHSNAEDVIAKNIKKLIPDIIICNYRPREMKYVYEHLDIVISMMLHSSIFAYGSSTRFINIAYDEKNFSFMNLINNEEYLIDMKNLDYETLFNKCIKLIEDKNYFAKVVDKKYFEMKINRFIAGVNSLIS